MSTGTPAYAFAIAPNHHTARMQTATNKRLTNKEKRQLAQILSLNFNNNKLKHGLIKRLASDFKISRITVYNIWKVVLKSIKDGILLDVDRKYKGRKRINGLDLER